MKYSKYCLLIFLLTLITQPVFAQQSIGFSDSTDFQYIIDYRLPDWGYSNFYLAGTGLNANGDYASGTNEYKEPNTLQNSSFKTSQNRFRINLNPTFDYYRESESRIINLTTTLSLNTDLWNRIDNNDEDPSRYGPDYNTSNKTNRIRYSLSLNSKFYVADGFFLQGSLNPNVEFRKQLYSLDHKTDPGFSETVEEFDRVLNLNPTLGIGIGRVRNVSPQLRAIRLNERYSLISEDQMNNTDIVEAASQFTKLNSYRNIYDRHEKYFWEDMNEKLSGKLDAINPYDMMYLTDVLNESLGQRLEGADLRFTGTFSYQNTLNREHTRESSETSLIRDFVLQRQAGTQILFRWYKNLDLKNQLSFTFNNSANFPLEKRNYTKWRFNSYANFSWLYTITDRYLLTTSLRNYYDTQEHKDRFSRSEQFRNQTYLSGSLSYFIENKLSLTGNISTGYVTHKNKDPDSIFTTNNLEWNFSVSLRYYFDRNLY